MGGKRYMILVFLCERTIKDRWFLAEDEDQKKPCPDQL